MTPLEENIYDVIQPLLGVEFIVMDQNKPRPQLPYAAFKVKAARAVHHDHYSDASAGGVQLVTGNREATVSIQYYGGEPIAALESVRDRLRLVSNMDAFRVRGLAAYHSEAVVDISEKQETQILKRANLDISIRYRSSLNDDVGIIEKADITGVVDTLNIHVVANV